jgi:antitoxin (DNA-binding transcriptional repressor) of toxin-antitoxin stability system
MKASVVELRYKTKEVLRALERRETVTVIYHGKAKAKIVPLRSQNRALRVAAHPFFGMAAADRRPLEAVLNDLRRSRHDF